MTATMAIRRSDLTPQPDKGADKFTVNYQGENLSILPNGTFSKSTNVGEYELFTVKDNMAFVTCSAYPTGSYVFVLVDDNG